MQIDKTRQAVEGIICGIERKAAHYHAAAKAKGENLLERCEESVMGDAVEEVATALKQTYLRDGEVLPGRPGGVFSVINPRERCWHVVLEFGPHSFTLIEYDGHRAQTDAESALHSIRENWKLYAFAFPVAEAPSPEQPS